MLKCVKKIINRLPGSVEKNYDFTFSPEYLYIFGQISLW